MEVFVYSVQEVANLKVQYFPRKLSDMTESHSETSDSQKVKEMYQNSQVWKHGIELQLFGPA